MDEGEGREEKRKGRGIGERKKENKGDKEGRVPACQRKRKGKESAQNGSMN